MLLEEDIYTTDSIWMKYWTCYYNGYLLLAGGGVGSRGSLQRIYCTFILVAGAIINADIFGNMAVLLDDIS
jgi:hypothetical protein